MEHIEAKKPYRPRWMFWLWLPVAFFGIAGVSLASVKSALLLLTFGLLTWRVETQARRPRRSFYRLALVSGLLFSFLVVGSATGFGSLVIGSLIWFAITILGLIWTIYYERTEPLA